MFVQSTKVTALNLQHAIKLERIVRSIPRSLAQSLSLSEFSQVAHAGTFITAFVQQFESAQSSRCHRSIPVFFQLVENWIDREFERSR